jgi:hypothetical protein
MISVAFSILTGFAFRRAPSGDYSYDNVRTFHFDEGVHGKNEPPSVILPDRYPTFFPAAVIGVGDRQQQGIAEYRHNVFESDAVLAQISRSLRVVPFEFVSGHPTGAFFVQSEIPSATAIRNVT